MQGIPKGFDVAEARRQQLTVARKVVHSSCLPRRVSLVGGVDVSYCGNQATAAVVVLGYADLELVETTTVSSNVSFPYIPTFLSYLEAPFVLKAFSKLRLRPDVLMVEGHGVAHPYRCGLASHVGVTLKMPTVGVAKGLLCGQLGVYRKGQAPILYRGSTVGTAIITKPGCNPLYISVGNMLTLKQAVRIVLHCIKWSKMPEPLRLAHMLARGQSQMKT